ncbi:hypothetical protein F5883DRAFT_51661 [Diaporthe sp. PMI_573]|nr:hypothetical protein F5883DRAFT_51661 [Diaporthaceae sp. PMI_573]
MQRLTCAIIPSCILAPSASPEPSQPASPAHRPTPKLLSSPVGNHPHHHHLTLSSDTHCIYGLTSRPRHPLGSHPPRHPCRLRNVHSFEAQVAKLPTCQPARVDHEIPGQPHRRTT